MATEIQSAITPERVAAAAVEFDEQDRALLVTGRERTLMTFQTTGLLASDLLPREWEAVAAWLIALTEHDPIKSSSGFAAHRILLGSFAGELRNFARQAGEPVGLEADLRAAGSKAEEKRIRDRIDAEAIALERHLDDIALRQAAQHVITEPPPTEEGEPSEPETPPQPPEKTDDAWLL